MDVVRSVLPYVAQPRNACVRGLRYRTLHVKMEYGFSCPCSQFGNSSPSRIPGAGRTVSTVTVPHKIDIDVFVSRPMTLEIVEERRPVERQSVSFEVLNRKRESVVYADKCWSTFEKHRNQPFSNALASPVFTWTRWWWDFLRDGSGQPHRHEDP